VSAPIELAPRARRGAVHVQFALASAIVLAVVVQVYLIGAYVFGAGVGALDAHRGVGFAAHGLEVLSLVVALIAGRDRRLALALAVLGTVQIALAGGHEWVGALHPLFALAVLALAGALAVRAWSLTTTRAARRSPTP
jgi:hypothetical protein